MPALERASLHMTSSGSKIGGFLVSPRVNQHGGSAQRSGIQALSHTESQESRQLQAGGTHHLNEVSSRLVINRARRMDEIRDPSFPRRQHSYNEMKHKKWSTATQR